MTQYTETNWVDGQSGNTPVDAANLNHMEQGIGDEDLRNPSSPGALAVDGLVAANVGLSGSQTQTAMDGRYAHVFMPEAFGAKGDHVTDDTTAVQSAINAAVSAGGSVLLSKMYYVPNGGLTASGPVAIHGIGGQLTTDATAVGNNSPLALSGILTATQTAAAVLTCQGVGTVLRDFAVINNVVTAPTAGAGIILAAASQCSVRGVSVVGYWVNIQTMGVFWTIESCHFYDAAKYSVWLNNTNASYIDHGDLGIVDCVIAQNYKPWGADAAIRWESGGGIRIVGNKILGGAAIGNTSAGGGSTGNHFLVGIDIMAADGVNTGDANITGNSISNFNTAGIRIGTQNNGGTAGKFIYATITGNNINVGWGSAVAAIFGSTVSGLQTSVSNVEFSGNNINNVPYGVVVQNVTSVHIGPNTWDSLTGSAPYCVSIAPAPCDGASTIGVTVDAQPIGELNNVDIVRDLRHPSSPPTALNGGAKHGWLAGVYTNTVGSWVTLGYFDLSAVDTAAGDLELIITGDDYGFGPVYARYRRIMTVSGAAAVTLTTDGTDTVAGTGSHYAVQFVITTNNRVIVQVQLTTSGVTLWGRARLTAGGDIARSHVGS